MTVATRSPNSAASDTCTALSGRGAILALPHLGNWDLAGANLAARGVETNVVTCVFSEFGRRVDDNDTSGTDHGTAASHFVIGDRVNGGLHGDAPSLTALDDSDNMINTVDFRQLYATVLDQWLKADSRQVLGYNFGALPLFKAGGPGGTGGTGGPGTPVTPVRPFRRLRKRLTAA